MHSDNNDIALQCYTDNIIIIIIIIIILIDITTTTITTKTATIVNFLMAIVAYIVHTGMGAQSGL